MTPYLKVLENNNNLMTEILQLASEKVFSRLYTEMDSHLHDSVVGKLRVNAFLYVLFSLLVVGAVTFLHIIPVSSHQ